MLAACARRQVPGQQQPAPVQLTSEEQKAPAVKAVQTVRANFEGGDCHFNHKGLPRALASNNSYWAGNMFDPQSPQWAGQCRDLRQTLGAWRSFTPSSLDSCGTTCVRLSGPAGFTNGAAALSADVMVMSGGAWVWSVNIIRNHDIWNFPAEPLWRKFQDAPMLPPVSRFRS
jgi:hypothetical protein